MRDIDLRHTTPCIKNMEMQMCKKVQCHLILFLVLKSMLCYPLKWVIWIVDILIHLLAFIILTIKM